MNPPLDDGRCFACGPENAIGLHVHFERTAQGVRAHVTLRDDFQGWRGMAHGGIVLALADEAMAHAAGAAGYRGVTASMSARFRKSVPLNAPLVVDGSVQWIRRNVLQVAASIASDAGEMLAQAEGRFVARGRVEDLVDRRNPQGG